MKFISAIFFIYTRSMQLFTYYTRETAKLGQQKKKNDK